MTTFISIPVCPAYADSINEQNAIRLAAEKNPGLQAAILELQAAQQAVTAAEEEYTTVLQIDTGVTHTKMPRATREGVTESSNDAIDLGIGASRRFPWGTELSLDVTGNGEISRVNPEPRTSDVIKLGPTYGLEARLGLSQPLLRGAGIDVGEAEIRASKMQQRAADHKRDRMASELLRDVLIGYWELWYSESALEVQHQARDLAQKQHEEAQLRAELGTVAPSDTLSFATQLALLEEAVAEAEVDRKSRAVELGQLLGFDPHRATALSPAPPTQQSSLEITRQQATQRARENSLELREQEVQIKLLQDKLKVAEDAVQSRLDLTAYLSAQGLGYRDTVEPLKQVGTLSAISGHVGLEFELPVSNAKRRAELAEARLNLDAAKAQFDEQLSLLEAETATWVDKLDAAQQRMTLAQQTVEVAQKLASAERERLELGTTTSLQVLQAQEDLRDAELRLLKVGVDRAAASIMLLHLTASLLPKYAQMIKGF